MTEDELVGWHHQLHGQEFEQAPGDGKGQGQSWERMYSAKTVLEEQVLREVMVNSRVLLGPCEPGVL